MLIRICTGRGVGLDRRAVTDRDGDIVDYRVLTVLNIPVRFIRLRMLQNEGSDDVLIAPSLAGRRSVAGFERVVLGCGRIGGTREGDQNCHRS